MTSRVEVQGRDAGGEAYRIATEVGRALVPEFLMQTSLRPGARPTHQEAYEWIAAHRQPLVRAVAALSRGDTPRAPYDTLTLLGAGSS